MGVGLIPATTYVDEYFNSISIKDKYEIALEAERRVSFHSPFRLRLSGAIAPSVLTP